MSADPRGRRFTPEQHAEALRLIAGGMEREAVAKHIGTTTESLRRWVQGARAAGTMPPAAARAVAPGTPTTSAPAIASPPSSAPKDPGAGLGEHETKAILDYKRKHPSMGPAQTTSRPAGRAESQRSPSDTADGQGLDSCFRIADPTGVHPQYPRAQAATWALTSFHRRSGLQDLAYGGEFLATTDPGPVSR